MIFRNKTQRKFKNDMRKISKQETRRKNKFYSYLERDIIYGYYSIKNKQNDKFVLAFIKVMQYIMCGLLLIAGLILAASVYSLAFLGIFLMLPVISFILLVFGFIHPNIIWAPHRFVARKRIVKLFGTATLLLLIVDVILLLLIP